MAMRSEPPAAAPEGVKQRTGSLDVRKEVGSGESTRRVLLSPWLTWPHPGLPELFVDEVHLVQAALDLLDAVGRRQGRVMEDSNST